MVPTAMRRIICQVFLVRPDPSNWSEYPNVWEEESDLIHDCPWFKVYDIAEAFHAAFALSLPLIPSCLPTTARLSGTDIILSQWIL